MVITDALRGEIEADIAQCESYNERKGSESLYGIFVAKYKVFDVNFEKGLSSNGKATVLGRDADYRQELKAIAGKLKMWLLSCPMQNAGASVHTSSKDNENSLINGNKREIKSITCLISEDILRLEQYILIQNDEKVARDLYLEITGRYDNLIKDFGKGLYSYLPEQHFYYPDVSIDTINYNLKLLLQKMISYQAINYGEQDKSENGEKIMSKKVFIVHGHDKEAKLEMARTLEKVGFEAIILHEKPSENKTIIEKIESNTDVSFAVVLYTPCDIGRAKEEKKGKKRARQNVVFEHGYLIGKLGRNHVCAFVKGDIEKPSDISGVVYVSMDDAGAWKMDLAREMTKAGLSVDMNKII